MNGRTLYETYVNSLGSSECKPVSKVQFGLIVSRVFDNIRTSLTHGNRTYQGIRRNVSEDRKCERKDINAIAEECGFYKTTTDENLRYAISTGECINNNEVLKVVELETNGLWHVLVSGHVVDLNILGLQNIKSDTYLNVQIIFNTVKKTKLCRGRTAQKGEQSTNFRIVQEWNKCHESTGELRLSSRKCNKLLSFTALSEACPACYLIKRCEKNEPKKACSDDDMLNKLFPGAGEQMIEHLREQSRRCRYTKDPRGYRWEKETIRIALSLWNRSPEVS